MGILLRILKRFKFLIKGSKYKEPDGISSIYKKKKYKKFYDYKL